MQEEEEEAEKEEVEILTPDDDDEAEEVALLTVALERTGRAERHDGAVSDMIDMSFSFNCCSLRVLQLCERGARRARRLTKINDKTGREKS